MAFVTFLKVAGIEGESTYDGHFKEIELWSFSFGLRHVDFQSVAKVEFGDLEVIKYVDCSSPRLMVACLTGELIESAILTVRLAHRDSFTVKLSKVLVRSTVIGGKETDDLVLPTETVTFSYQKISFDYILPNIDGSQGTLISADIDCSSLRGQVMERGPVLLRTDGNCE